MKGGGGLEGVSFAIKLFWKIIFVKNHLESFPDCENVFCTFYMSALPPQAEIFEILYSSLFPWALRSIHML